MKRLLFFLFISLSHPCLLGQQDSLAVRFSRFIDHVEAFNRLYPQEKVYLHFDNTGYFLGETIWFQAYVVNAGDHRPTTGSGVLYVELLNSRGALLDTKKLKITDGQCNGDFYLNLFNCEYFAGYYEIRAYTKMMLNFGEETVFSRVFPVFNPPEKVGNYSELNMDDYGVVRRLNLPLERKKPEKRKTVNMDFYPEGGHLVKGLSSRIAFKVTDERGQGIEVQGSVLNQKNEVVGNVSTLHGGMGVFDYLPDGNRNKVQIRYQNKTYTFDLPESLPSGFVLQTNSLLPNYIILEIRKSPDIAPVPLGLSVLCRDRLVSFRTIELDKPSVLLRIPKEALPSGVNQITLFDSKGEVYAERLVFISPQEKEIPVIRVCPDQPEYSYRERITIDFQAVPSSTFSLSVRDASTTIETPDAGTIQTHLLLSSDLKGFIENPSYYFEKQDASRQQALDLLMLVQGWRCYEWKQLAGITPFQQKYDLEKGLKIKGYVAGKADTLSIELALEDSNYLEDRVPLDSSHCFSTDIPVDLQGKYSMLLRSPGLKKANLNIRLDRWFSPPPRRYYPIEQQAKYVESEENLPDEKAAAKQPIVTAVESYSDSMDQVYEIEEIQVSGERGKDLIYNVERDREKAIDEGKWYPENAFYYLVKKNNGFFHKSAVREIGDNIAGSSGAFRWGIRAFELRYMINEREWKYITKDPRYPTYKGPKTYFVDLEEIQRIVIKEWQKGIDYGEPYIPGYLYPYEGTIYSVYRKNEDYRVSSFSGYSQIKNFYTGRPEREDYLPGREEHLRTLYWNPKIKTDGEGKARISFYNSAFCRKITISSEGLTKEGALMVNTNF